MISHLVLDPKADDVRYAILLKGSSCVTASVISHYIDPLVKLGLERKHFVLIGISGETDKMSAKESKDNLTNVAKGLKKLGVNDLLVPNSNFFKYIAKVVKTGNSYGESIKGVLPGFEEINVTLSIDYNALLYNDSLTPKLDNSLNVFANRINNVFKIEKDVLESMEDPHTIDDVVDLLDAYLCHPRLSCDIETYSLRFQKAKIATIAFAFDKHNGAVIHVEKFEQKEINALLVDFFENYTGQLIFHNALYDCKVLIYQAFMQTDMDLSGLHRGLEAFSNVDDSMLITYLATNSTHENPLGLKDNSFEYMGNYAEDVKDISLLELEDLKIYNVKDCLATLYVMDKYTPIVEADGQFEIYKDVLQPSIKPILYMMLIGMPMDMDTVHNVKKELEDILHKATIALEVNKYVKQTVFDLKVKRLADANKKLKKKSKTLSEIADEPFNPKSSRQIGYLLYEVLGLPIIYTTDKGSPSTDGKTLKALAASVADIEVAEIMGHLKDVADVSIILNNFVKNFIELGHEKSNGTFWLNGNLRLGGTQSGRLSSNSPNMQNMPSGSKYGKLIKNCFKAPYGWLMAGADFASLEDRINALLTHDPNKIKVYTDGYDGHCLRAHSYFGDEMPDIIDTVDSINSIEHKYPDLRQKSKAPTFALTYLGTWITLVKNLGISKQEAKSIEANYHELYKVSDQFADDEIQSAMKVGYVKCAFGLRLRTPLLSKTFKSNKHKIHAAEAEGRSAVNAISQSWGMLINVTAIEILKRILDSPYKDKIFPINTIHDAIYFVILDDPQVIEWLNINLIEVMEWNDHPLIKSDDVPMSADMTIGRTWDKQFSLTNNAAIEEIEAIRSKISANNI